MRNLHKKGINQTHRKDFYTCHRGKKSNDDQDRRPHHASTNNFYVNLFSCFSLLVTLTNDKTKENY